MVDGRKDLWQLTVEPSGTGPVSILAPQDRACTETGALCTADGRSLTVSLALQVPGPPPQQANSPATGAPAIRGTAQVGETLTVDTSGIADADGLTNSTYSYQWVANDGTTDTDIAGATDAAYTLAAGDEGRTIQVKVTFTDDAENEETLTSAATEAVGFAVQQQGASNTPTTGAPAITGTPQVGETLTVDISGIADADGLVNATYSYQWLSDDAEIGGATGSTYTLVAADEGQTIMVRVIVTDDAENETTLTSAATEAVEAAPQPNSPATGLPTISGTTQVGETLTADTSGIADDDGSGQCHLQPISGWPTMRTSAGATGIDLHRWSTADAGRRPSRCGSALPMTAENPDITDQRRYKRGGGSA